MRDDVYLTDNTSTKAKKDLRLTGNKIKVVCDMSM